MNSYSFPETVTITDYARDLIQKILNNDPSRRPTVDEILTHNWINDEGTIPRLLPPSTLACPPSSTYIRQFMPQNQGSGEGGNMGSTQQYRSNNQGFDNAEAARNRTDRYDPKNAPLTQNYER